MGGKDFQKNFARSFEWGTGVWVKMPRFNAFSRNVNTVNPNFFPRHSGLYKLEKIQQPFQRTFYHFLGSTLRVKIFFKKRDIRKMCIEIKDWGTYIQFVLGFQENSTQSLAIFFYYCCLVIKCSIFFDSWLFNSFHLPSYGSHLRKIYTLRLLSMCLGRGTPILDKAHSSLIFLDGLFSA